MLSLSGVLEAQKTHTDSDNTLLWWFVIVPVIDIHRWKEGSNIPGVHCCSLLCGGKVVSDMKTYCFYPLLDLCYGSV